MSRIKMIAMDVDGTLLNHEGKISQENADAIRAAQDAGVIAAIATGRLPADLHIMLSEMKLSCPVVGINGCFITDENNHSLHESFLSMEKAIEIQSILRNLDTEYNVNFQGGTCISRKINHYVWEEEYCQKLSHYGIKVFFGGDNAVEIVHQYRVYKFFAYNCRDVQEVRDALKNIEGIYLSQSGSQNVEIMPVGTDKGTGVSSLAKHYSISIKDVMTLGDEMNDLPMLKTAGWGVAMENGSALAKSAARYITRTCDRNGVACAIWRFVL